MRRDAINPTRPRRPGPVRAHEYGIVEEGLDHLEHGFQLRARSVLPGRCAHVAQACRRRADQDNTGPQSPFD